MTLHTCRRYELKLLKDMTHGSNTNKITIWNLKRIKSKCKNRLRYMHKEK